MDDRAPAVVSTQAAASPAGNPRHGRRRWGILLFAEILGASATVATLTTGQPPSPACRPLLGRSLHARHPRQCEPRGTVRRLPAHPRQAPTRYCYPARGPDALTGTPRRSHHCFCSSRSRRCRGATSPAAAAPTHRRCARQHRRRHYLGDAAMDCRRGARLAACTPALEGARFLYGPRRISALRGLRWRPSL